MFQTTNQDKSVFSHGVFRCCRTEPPKISQRFRPAVGVGLVPPGDISSSGAKRSIWDITLRAQQWVIFMVDFRGIFMVI